MSPKPDGILLYTKDGCSKYMHYIFGEGPVPDVLKTTMPRYPWDHEYYHVYEGVKAIPARFDIESRSYRLQQDLRIVNGQRLLVYLEE